MISPTVQQRAAEVIERAFLDTRQGKMRNDWVTGEEVAAALAAAGLLADPTTSLTEAEQAVIDAARDVVDEWIVRGDGGCSTNLRNALRDAVDALAAAVDRLAAPGPEEANQSRYGCDLCGTGFGHHSTSCRLAAPGPKEATP